MIVGSPYGLRKRIGLCAGPLLFAAILLVPVLGTGAPGELSVRGQHALAVAVLMAVWWITEALPLAATAMLPLFLYPFLGVMSAQETAEPYGSPLLFLFLGGFWMAMAMQKWNLHKRIALYISLFYGHSARGLIFGFMAATAFLSAWISNTACAVMMLPIAVAVAEQYRSRSAVSEKAKSAFSAALVLGIAYAANIGGMATLVGSPTNIIFAGSVAKLCPEFGPVSFSQWMFVGLPLVLCFLPVAWAWMCYAGFKVPKEGFGGGREHIRQELAVLGPPNRGEKFVFGMFLLTAAAFVTRGDLLIGELSIDGWASRLGLGSLVDDGTVAMAAAIILFCTPIDWKKGDFALDWEWAGRIPWNILLLLGGGFCLAKSFTVSGLAAWMGGNLVGMKGLPEMLLVAGVCLFMTFLTEVTSNTAVAGLMMPILAAMAVEIGVHPFLLMVPATFSASCAFMLPVATPPNAIVFGSGYLTIPQMAKNGLAVNFIGAALITVLMMTVGRWVFGIA